MAQPREADDSTPEDEAVYGPPRPLVLDYVFASSDPTPIDGEALNFALFVEEGRPELKVPGRVMPLDCPPGATTALVLVGPKMLDFVRRLAADFNAPPGQSVRVQAVSPVGPDRNNERMRDLAARRFPSRQVLNPESFWGYRIDLEQVEPDLRPRFWAYAGSTMWRYYSQLGSGKTEEEAFAAMGLPPVELE